MLIKVIIAAGGTGGHLFPALSLKKALNKKAPQSEFLFIGTGRPLEKVILKNEPLRLLNVSGIKGYGLLGKIKAVWQAFLAVFEARKIIKEFKPQLCFVTGGYVCGPVALASKLLKVPIVVHEQNSRPGVTNKLLSKISNLVLVGFLGAKKSFKAKKVIYVGNPIREEIAALNNLKKTFNISCPTILVMGGSQGAKKLNTTVLANLIELKKEGLNFKVIHQTGAADIELVAKAYKANGVEAVVQSFFTEMDTLYKKVDLGIFRAGALTIAEVMAAKIPAIFVPLPTAADNHQLINALELVGNKAAVLVEEKNLESGTLKVCVKSIINNEKALEELSQNVGQMFQENVAAKMADLCLEVILKGNK